MTMNVGFTPVNQVRLTNVAYVRLQKKGKRFEIACYRNKVLNWRNKIETDITEVLQIDTVFINVSKGMLASSKDLIEVFGTSDQKTVCKEILDKGELQVSEQERGALYESVFRDVASIVADKTVNSETNRPFTISMIQNAMKQIQYSVSVSKNSKSQALDVIRKLRDIMPIVRANMLLRVVCIASESESIRAELVPLGAVIVVDPNSKPEVIVAEGDLSSHAHKSHPLQRQCFIDLRVDPESFRRVEEIVAEKTAGTGRVEVIQLRVANSHSTTAAVAASTQQTHGIHVENGDGDAVHGDDADRSKAPLPVSKSAAQKELKSRQRGNLIEQHILSSVDAAASLLVGLDDKADLLDEEAIGIVRKEKKKNRPKKKVVVSAPVARSSLPDSLSEGDEEDGEQADASDSEDEDAMQLAMGMSASLSIADSEASHRRATQSGSVVAGAGKKGKKSRRMEKEEMQEREKKASVLKERVAAQQQQHVFVVAETTSTTTVEPTTTVAPASTGAVQSCNTCGGAFHDVKDYRNHFRSEWHRHNLSRKMKGLPLVSSEEAFLSLSLEELDL